MHPGRRGPRRQRLAARGQVRRLSRPGRGRWRHGEGLYPYRPRLDRQVRRHRRGSGGAVRIVGADRRRDRRIQGRQARLLDAEGRDQRRRRHDPVCLRPAPSRRRGPDPSPHRRPQGAAGAADPVRRRPPPLCRTRAGRGRGAVRRDVRAGPGGSRLQARRRTLSRRTYKSVDQDQVPAPAGVRDRRLDAFGQEARIQVAAARRPRRGHVALCRQGRHRLHPGTDGRTARQARRAFRRRADSGGPPRDSARREVGPPRAGRGNRLCGGDPRQGAAPLQLHRPAGRQAGARGGGRDARTRAVGARHPRQGQQP